MVKKDIFVIFYDQLSRNKYGLLLFIDTKTHFYLNQD